MKIMLVIKNKLKMKKIINKVSILLLSMMILSSCNENDNDVNIYDGDDFISFGASTSGSLLENDTNSFKITAYASMPEITEAFTVSVALESTDAISGVDYVVVDGKDSFSFGPNQHEDTIEITAVDNLNPETDKTITLSLTSASNSTNIGLPGPDVLAKVFTLTLVEDDCPFTIQELGDALWSGTDSSSGSEGPNASQITTSYDGTDFTFEGIGYGWITNTDYWNEPVIDSQKVIASVDALTGDITIDLQYMCRTTYLGVVQDDYYVQGSGKYISCSETMEINYDIIQGGGILRSFTETISIQ